ncbi:MAG: hypothetical protein QOE22_286 [Candidatus Parcubacteria bacterium]|jgi:hypothetical protein|nr:hypothetical protein [Candidatus Parcubacteria bacterium]
MKLFYSSAIAAALATTTPAQAQTGRYACLQDMTTGEYFAWDTQVDRWYSYDGSTSRAPCVIRNGVAYVYVYIDQPDVVVVQSPVYLAPDYGYSYGYSDFYSYRDGYRNGRRQGIRDSRNRRDNRRHRDAPVYGSYGGGNVIPQHHERRADGGIGPQGRDDGRRDHGYGTNGSSRDQYPGIRGNGSNYGRPNNGSGGYQPFVPRRGDVRVTFRERERNIGDSLRFTPRREFRNNYPSGSYRDNSPRGRPQSSGGYHDRPSGSYRGGSDARQSRPSDGHRNRPRRGRN